MSRLVRLIALTVLALFASVSEASAQRSRRVAKKPFAAFSESAQRLRDSLAMRVQPAAGFSAPPLVFALSTFDEMTMRDSVLTMARSQIGTRYRLGAETPGKAFDCSGLIRYVMSALRVDLPRTADEQAKLGREVARDTTQLRPGDLLTFGTKRRITHIGIYAGNGKVIHASTSRRSVIETSLASLGPSLLRNWRSARRLIDTVDPIPEVQ
ncbi:MAG: C40 family peptidase [Gemmatimonadaceae bacterium]|nr:C40 family peptidase [Gemmatimonadaceae bacterium]